MNIKQKYTNKNKTIVQEKFKNELQVINFLLKSKEQSNIHSNQWYSLIDSKIGPSVIKWLMWSNNGC